MRTTAARTPTATSTPSSLLTRSLALALLVARLLLQYFQRNRFASANAPVSRLPSVLALLFPVAPPWASTRSAALRIQTRSLSTTPLWFQISPRYIFFLFQILYLLTFFLTRSNSVALRATTCPPRKALLLANLSNGAKGVRTASTAVRRAVLMHSIPTLSWILLSASALFLPRIPKVRSFFLLVIFISYLFL